METRARVAAPDGLDANAMLGRVLGGYRLTSVIGGGGMGIVFEAKREGETTGPEVVAVKVLSPAFSRDPDFVARFEREADALLSLEHDNLIRVFEKGAQDGYYFFVMERFDGDDLRAVMRRGGLGVRAIAAIVRGAAAGLAHAHRNGIVHRDIKPANILVRGDPSTDGAVKVVDFGVAQLAAPDYTLTSLTHSNLILGTVNYMSPEQRLDASRIDHRADIYALAVVAYELLTERLPIGAFEPPSQLAKKLRRSVDAALLRALRRDPEDRPRSILAFAEALEKGLLPRRSKLPVAAGLVAAASIAAFVAMQPSESPKPVAETKVAVESTTENVEEAPKVWTPSAALVALGASLSRDAEFLAQSARKPVEKSPVSVKKSPKRMSKKIVSPSPDDTK